MSYNDIATRYPKYHRRVVSLGAHVERTFPMEYDAGENLIPHAERDHLLELVAQGWEDMRQGKINRVAEQTVVPDVVTLRPVDVDHEDEQRDHVLRIGKEFVSWSYTARQLTDAGRARAAAAASD